LGKKDGLNGSFLDLLGKGRRVIRRHEERNVRPISVLTTLSKKGEKRERRGLFYSYHEKEGQDRRGGNHGNKIATTNQKNITGKKKSAMVKR